MASATLDTPDTATNGGRSLSLRESGALSTSVSNSLPMMFNDGSVDLTGKALTIGKLWHCFRRRWLAALFFAAIVSSALFVTLWIMMPTTYEVMGVVKVTYGNQTLYGTRSAFADVGDRNNFRATLKHLITSDVVLSLALEQSDDRQQLISQLSTLKNAVDPKEYLKKALTVIDSEGSDYLGIRMSGNKPDDMVSILNAVMQSFINFQNDQERLPLNQTIAKLNKEYAETQLNHTRLNEIVHKEMELSSDLRSYGSLAKKQLIEKDISTMDRELIEMAARRGEVARQISLQKYLTENQEIDTVDELALDYYYKDLPQIGELQRRHAQATEILSSNRAIYKSPRHPSVISAQRQVDELDLELAKVKKQLRPLAMARMRDAGNNNTRLTPLPLLEAEYKKLEKDLEERSNQLSAKRAEYTNMDKAVVELESKRRDLGVLEAKLKGITAAKEDAEGRLKHLTDNPRLEILSRPEKPKSGSSLNRVLISLMSGVMGGLAIIGLVVLVNSRHHYVNSIDEVALPGPGLKVLGTVPNLARIRGGADGASAVLAESIDTVRTILLQGNAKNGVRTLLVTSAGEGEGKTTVATHLAASLARVGKRTLLIDGDLRKPSLHLLFGMPQQAGVCELLRGEAKPAETITPAQLEGLFLLQAGNCDHTALANLAKSQAQNLFLQLQHEFDYVIIDAGPVLGYADALLLGGYADAAVLTVLRDVSHLPEVYESRSQLEGVGIPVLGAVVGRVPGANRAAA